MYTTSCSVGYLRILGYNNIRDWIETPGNVHAVRSGRVFINKEPYHYEGNITLANNDKLPMKEYYKAVKDFDLTYLDGCVLSCFCAAASYPTPALDKCVCHTQVLRHVFLGPNLPQLPEYTGECLISIGQDTVEEFTYTKDTGKNKIYTSDTGKRLMRKHGDDLFKPSSKYPVIIPLEWKEYMPWKPEENPLCMM